MSASAAVIKRKPKGIAAMFKVQRVRHLIQIVFFGFIAYLVAQAALVAAGGTSTAPSAEAFCPFGGVETLYKFITTGGQTINHTHLSNVVVLIATLASALIFRSAFCGWICPFGTLQEGIMALSVRLQRHIPSLAQGDQGHGEARHAARPARPLAALRQVHRSGLDHPGNRSAPASWSSVTTTPTRHC